MCENKWKRNGSQPFWSYLHERIKTNIKVAARERCGKFFLFFLKYYFHFSFYLICPSHLLTLPRCLLLAMTFWLHFFSLTYLFSLCPPQFFALLFKYTKGQVTSLIRYPHSWKKNIISGCMFVWACFQKRLGFELQYTKKNNHPPPAVGVVQGCAGIGDTSSHPLRAWIGQGGDMAISQEERNWNV